MKYILKYNESNLPGRDVNKHNYKINKIVSDRFGKLIDGYKSSKTKLKIICSDGHEFMISPHKLYDGKWCPKCTNSISEELTRFIFEEIYSKKFEKFKFWHKNHFIELDGYNKDLNIAFEYNGIQHYRKNGFIRTDDQLKHQQYLDSLKVEYCEENNIKFVIIPYTINHYDIVDYLKRELDIDSDIKINYNDFTNTYSYSKIKRKELESYASNKDGRILELGSDFVKLECKRGHIWKLKNYLLKKGVWCRKCYLIDGYTHLVNNRTSVLSFIEIKNRCKEMGVDLLTSENEYAENKKTLKLKCRNNHIFEITKVEFFARYQSIKTKEKSGRKICQRCLSPDQNIFLEKLNGYGISPLDKDEYEDRNSMVLWKFTCGHDSLDKARNILERINRSNNTKCKECTNNKNK